MAITISSPAAGSLKITNTAASPMSNYLCNLKTVQVGANANSGEIYIQNELSQNIFTVQRVDLTTVAASTPTFWTFENAVAALASLIIT